MFFAYILILVNIGAILTYGGIDPDVSRYAQTYCTIVLPGIWC
jgi:MATE family multidrug resistance protein